MIAYIQYFPETKTLGVVDDIWHGKPSMSDMVVYTAWPAVGGVIAERWYKYAQDHDARLTRYDQLPEAVRLAYMLMQ